MAGYGGLPNVHYDGTVPLGDLTVPATVWSWVPREALNRAADGILDVERELRGGLDDALAGWAAGSDVAAAHTPVRLDVLLYVASGASGGGVRSLATLVQR